MKNPYDHGHYHDWSKGSIPTRRGSDWKLVSTEEKGTSETAVNHQSEPKEKIEKSNRPEKNVPKELLKDINSLCRIIWNKLSLKAKNQENAVPVKDELDYNIDSISDPLFETVVELCTKNQKYMDKLKESFKNAGLKLSFSPVLETITNEEILPKKAPILWRDRRPENARNPVEFIREVYGTWLYADGLSRRDISDLDMSLYNAYAQWISRHPEDVIQFAPTRPRHHIADPVEAISRRRESVKEASARYRNKRRTLS